MEEYELFPTTLWSVDLNLDLDELRKEVYKFSKVTPSERYTNAGGYQGHCFNYEPLTDAIKRNIPQYEDPELGDVYISTWVNINGRDDYNRRHAHADGINLLSGVYYVSVPENSGNIVFLDPRPIITHSFADMRYYSLNGSNILHEYKIKPEEDKLLLFPCWLEHHVEANKTDEDRISISFNLVREKDVDRYQEIYNFTKL
tara:strand:+ start:64 stop:666 length:603 start_codon:yes stop_codon:yes gene_type:complete